MCDAVGVPQQSAELIDARRSELTLAGPEQAAYLYYDELRSLAAILQHLRAHVPSTSFAEQPIRDFLEALAADQLMVSDGVHYLSLALLPDTPPTTALQAASRPASSYLLPQLSMAGADTHCVILRSRARACPTRPP
jgi:hypothetical protein